MEVIDDFDKAVLISSRKSHIRIHFRKNKKRGLETLNMVISFNQLCCIERNGSVTGGSGVCFFCF